MTRPNYTENNVKQHLLRFGLCLFKDETVQALVAFNVRASCQNQFFGFGGRIFLIDQTQIGPSNPEGFSSSVHGLIFIFAFRWIQLFSDVNFCR
jgi:hypothetical protein